MSNPLFAALILLFQLTPISCNSIPIKTKNEIILIHGAHFDGQSWKTVAKDLEKKGFQTLSPSLPGRTHSKNVDLDTLAKFVCAESKENSILVGHSQGGAVINQMLGICPSKIKEIIYITAVVPFPKEKAFDYLEKRDEKWYFKAVEFKNDLFTPKNQGAFFQAFAQDFSNSASNKRLLPPIYSEPAKIGETALNFDKAHFEQIPKCYIHATADQIVTLASQRKYTQRTHFDKVLSITSGHLPMLSKPEETSLAIQKCLEM